jgi:hypothetical protein
MNWWDRHEPATDWGAREHLIVKFLEARIGDDPRKVETFRLLMEARVVGRSLEELAREQRTTPTALKKRLQRLIDELIPHVSIMDREKPRRMFLLALFFFGAMALLAVVVALLWNVLRPPPPPALPVVEPPAPSASAPPAPEPPPEFDNALPTQPGPAPSGDAGAKDLERKR